MGSSFPQKLNLGEMQITDAVVVAKLLNATLVVPELDHKSYWKDQRLAFLPCMCFAYASINLIKYKIFNISSSRCIVDLPMLIIVKEEVTLIFWG